ncbi:MAG: hypothetical protein KatS3mg087_1313 [Patescibacteria group bacterium]|nr:MAG: hypothetical protein KatS3mg087_1313 [Patescibacteria group bacterium]
MMRRPRIFLIGASSSLKDLGVSWRLAVAKALEKKGYEPIWPPSIEDVKEYRASVDEIKDSWAKDRIANVRQEILHMLRCDGILVEKRLPYYRGTEALYMVALWADMPIIECDASNLSNIKFHVPSSWHAKRIGWMTT